LRNPEGEAASGSRVGLVADLAQLLGALPGDEQLEVAFVGVDGGGEPGLLTLGEPFGGAAHQVPDPVERVVLAAPVAVDACSSGLVGVTEGRESAC
jgi:hypothetical protein